MWTIVQQVFHHDMQMDNASSKRIRWFPLSSNFWTQQITGSHSFSLPKPMLALLLWARAESPPTNLWNSWKKNTVSRQKWVLARFGDMVEAIRHWNILKLSNPLVKASTFIYCTASLGPKMLQRKDSAWQKMSCPVVSAECAKETLSTHIYEGRWLEERVKKMRSDSNSIFLIWCVSRV